MGSEKGVLGQRYDGAKRSHPLLSQGYGDETAAGAVPGRTAVLRPLRHARHQPAARRRQEEAAQVARAGVVGATLPNLPAPLLPLHGEGGRGVGLRPIQTNSATVTFTEGKRSYRLSLCVTIDQTLRTR